MFRSLNGHIKNPLLFNVSTGPLPLISASYRPNIASTQVISCYGGSLPRYKPRSLLSFMLLLIYSRRHEDYRNIVHSITIVTRDPTHSHRVPQQQYWLPIVSCLSKHDMTWAAVGISIHWRKPPVTALVPISSDRRQ